MDDPENLQEENKLLKEKLLEYKKLEEDLLADRVYKKAKEKLVGWYSIGGIVLFLAGLFGVNEGIKYVKGLAESKLKEVTVEETRKLIERSAEKHIRAFIKPQEDSIQLLLQQTRGQLILANSNIKGSRDGSSPAVVFPAKIDLSTDMNPVRDQGTESSVVAFAAAGALEYQILVRDKQRVVISTRFIYNSINNGVDNGAMPEDAFKLLRDKGAVEEKAWPYVDGMIGVRPPPGLAAAKHYKIKSYEKVTPSVNLFKEYLFQKVPLIVIMTFYPSFQNYPKLIEAPQKGEQPDGSIAICLAGYDDATKCFKFRNSWGKEYADGGYFYIRYDDISKFSLEAYALNY